MRKLSDMVASAANFNFVLIMGFVKCTGLAPTPIPARRLKSCLEYCERSCSEIKTSFEKLMLEIDFQKQALELGPVKEAMTHGLAPLEKLAFVAYFVDGAEWSGDQSRPVFTNPVRFAVITGYCPKCRLIAHVV